MRKKQIVLSGGRQQVLVVGEAPDVYEPHKTQRVVRNMREHALSYLEHQGRITPDQKLAGDTFRRHYECAMLGAARAIDYTRIRVDGGVVAEPLTERMQEAHRWLSEAAKIPGVGQVGYQLLVNVAGEGQFVSEVARRWEGSHAPGSARAEGYIMGRLCEALDEISKHFGMVAVGKAKRR